MASLLTYALQKSDQLAAKQRKTIKAVSQAELARRPEQPPSSIALLEAIAEGAVVRPPARWDYSEVTKVVEGCLRRSPDGKHTPTTLEEYEAMGIGYSDVVRVIVGLGVWLGQGQGRVETAATQLSYTFSMWDEAEPIDDVIVPAFLEGSASRQAFLNIVGIEPSDKQIRRFVIRQSTYFPPVLSYHHLRDVWDFYQADWEGQLHEVAKACPAPMGMAKCHLAAWRLLDARRVQAVEGLIDILRAAVTSDYQYIELALHVEAARPLNEVEFRSLVRSLKMDSDNGVESLEDSNEQRQKIDSELRRLFDHVTEDIKGGTPDDGSGQWLPATIKQMSFGQVVRIAQSSGLAPDDSRIWTKLYSPEEEEEADELLLIERAVRLWIRQAQLNEDEDQLMPVGVQAVNFGFEAEYRDALQKRSVGDLAWATELQECFSSFEPDARV